MDIRQGPSRLGIFNSVDDPLIPIREARFVAAQLRCSYFESIDRGHFTETRELPEVLKFVQRKVQGTYAQGAGALLKAAVLIDP